MRIAKIVLHNVKSYGAHTTIDLAPGINAICGENGAGKSTILEAIGYTLFGYRPYKLEAFLRDGEKSGVITITVEDENGCSFEVVRKLGAGSGQSVYNELGQRIAEGEADVRRWLTDFLRLEEGTDIAKLFEDAVGPPQGTLTAIFLESASTRKQKFDRLLGIEDYRTAAENLRPVSNLFRDEAVDADKRAALLEGDARRLPEVEERRAALVKRQAELGQELQGLLTRQEGLAAELEGMDRTKQAIQMAESRLSLAEARARDADRRRDDLAAQLARAEEAANIVAESRRGYLAFQAASDLLRQLDQRRQQRDTLSQRAELAARTAVQWEQRLQGYAEQIAALDRDEANAVDLEAQVPEQEKREGTLREAEERLRAREEATRQFAVVEERRRAAEERLREAERRIAAIEEARPIAAELAGLRERERALLASKARLEQQIQALRQGGEGLAESQRRLEEKRREMEQVARQIDVLRPLEALAMLAGARQQERDEAASVLASLDAQHKEAVRTRSQVGGGLCPFFHEPCKNLREGISLDAHFDGVIATTSTELASARTRLVTSEAGLAEARTAERSFSRLPDLERHVRQLEDDISKLDQEVRKLAGQQSELAGLPAEQGKVAAELRALEPRLARAEAAWEVVSGEAGWRSQATEATLAVERERNTAVQLSAIVETTAGVEEAVAAARADLAKLDDPRASAATLRARIARERPVAERNREQAQRDAAGARAAEEKARQALEPYTALEAEIAEATATRDEAQTAHNLFIANHGEAGRLEERQTAHGKAVTEAEQAGEALEAAHQSMENLKASYDEAAHLRVRQAVEELRAAIAGTRTELDLKSQEDRRLVEEMSSLLKSREEMEAIQKRGALARQLRDAVEALRWALNEAGPEMARALLRRISDRATGLYRDLLGDPTVSLEWTSDYEIRARLGTGTFEFKQFSGGEGMAAALAVRLALLQTISSLRVAFLDEPTAHMDTTRRTNLAAQIQNLRSFNQLVVISHDDSFDTLFGHVVRLVKRDGATVVEP